MPTFKPKPCKICGKIFTPTSRANSICDDDHYSSCPVCGKPVLWNSARAVEPCSRECSKVLTKRRNLEKYGVEHPMQSKVVQGHHKAAMVAKYGVESPLQSEEIRAKAIETNRERFGTDWALGNKDVKKKAEATMIERYGAPTTLQSEELRRKVAATCLNIYGIENPASAQSIKDKITTTMILKYGVDSIAKDPENTARRIQTRLANNGQYWTDDMQEKAKQTFLEKYGVDNPSKSPEIKEKIRQTMIERYGEDYGVMLSECNKHHISQANLKFKEMLEAKGVEVTLEKHIGQRSYDICIESTKTVVEINPSYTHNALGNHWSESGLPKDYHKMKTALAKEAGYRCLHVFDWDDWAKVIDLLVPRHKIYARDCKLFRLNSDITTEFLNKHHLQGSVKGNQLCLGLVKDNEIYEVMTFGEPRYDTKHSAELLRLCTRSGYQVVGGASKLFKYATDCFLVDNIISYCDLAKFNGDVYEKLGMKKIRETEPQEVWSNGSKKITANLLRSRGFDQLFGTNYGKGTDNELLMIDNGWLPVFDCGQAVYEYKRY